MRFYIYYEVDAVGECCPMIIRLGRLVMAILIDGRGRPSGKANLWEKINTHLVKRVRKKTLKHNRRKKLGRQDLRQAALTPKVLRQLK